MEAIDVFIAYAQQDKPLMKRLRKQLSAAERIGLVDAWHDGEIEVGTNREEAAQKAMEAAEIVVLLLSADFFASEYLYEKEMAQALELSKAGKITLVPVLLKECTWQLTPIANLQIFPKNAIPVTNEHWKHPDRAFKQIVDEIIRISNQIKTEKGIPPITYSSTESEEITIKKTITKTLSQDTEEDKMPLLKLAIYAFAGLAAFALISYLINTAFSKPNPEGPITQEEPLTLPPSPKEQALEQTPNNKPKKDVKNSPFSSLTISNLEWSAQNINQEVVDSWCYQDTPANCTKNGRLYNFDSAVKICPQGWRLPSKEEWLALSSEDISKLNLTKGGVYDRGYYRQKDQIGYYFTSERSGGGEAWIIEYRGNEKPLQRDRRYVHWGMSCRCVR